MKVDGDGDALPSPVDCDDSVEHVVDAVDFLLDRRGDGLGHRLGRGAGIAGGDRHGRRDDVGILRDRQRQIGDRADDRDDDRDDRREDRARDEETRERRMGLLLARGAYSVRSA